MVSYPILEAPSSLRRRNLKTQHYSYGQAYPPKTGEIKKRKAGFVFKCGQNSFSLRNKPSRTSRMKSGRTVASRFFKPSTFRTSPITRTKGRPLSRTLNVLNFASNFSNYLIFQTDFLFPWRRAKSGFHCITKWVRSRSERR